MGSASTEHQNLDREAAEQELLEKMQDTWPQMPREILETLDAELDRTRHSVLERGAGRGELSSDKQWIGSARQKRSRRIPDGDVRTDGAVRRESWLGKGQHLKSSVLKRADDTHLSENGTNFESHCNSFFCQRELSGCE